MAAFESTDLSISQLFRDFYVVPDYQREFVWSKTEVRRLLTDIRDEQNEDQTAQYFIGSFIVCPNVKSKNNTFDLIDGQQRVTTLFITMISLRDRMLELGSSSVDGVRMNISATHVNEYGQDQSKAHLEAQYKDAGNALDDLISGEEITETPTKSIRNIKGAYNAIYDFLVEEFGDDENELRKFFAYLIHNVKIIRISADSFERALVVFETVNSRGVGLTHFDLLKNLIFTKVNAKQADELKVIWKKIIDSIHETAGLDPTGFLRLFIVSNWGVVLKKSETYKWIQENNDKINLDDEPIEFAQKMLTAVSDYRRFRSNQNTDGTRNAFLENISFMDGRMRQHLVILLAARHFSRSMFNKLCADLETLIFVHLICGRHGNALERELSKWCGAIASVITDADYEQFRQEYFVTYKANLSRLFVDSLMNLNEVKKNFNGYILAKMTQAVDAQGYGDRNSIATFGKNFGTHIEHILPQNPSAESKVEFGEGWDNPDNVNALGNLTLLEKSINTSIGNGAFSKKRELFAKSRFLLTKSIVERPNIGNTAIDRAVAEFEPFTVWNQNSIETRTRYLTDLALDIWDVPNPRVAVQHEQQEELF